MSPSLYSFKFLFKISDCSDKRRSKWMKNIWVSLTSRHDGQCPFEPFCTLSFASKARYRLRCFKGWCLVKGPGHSVLYKKLCKRSKLGLIQLIKRMILTVNVQSLWSSLLFISSRSLSHSVHLLLIRSKQIITAGCYLCCVDLHMLELLLSADMKLHLRLFPVPTPPALQWY